MPPFPAPPFPCPLLQCFLSAGDKQLAIYFHLPKELSAAKSIALKEWATALLAPIEGVQVCSRGLHCFWAAGRAGEQAGLHCCWGAFRAQLAAAGAQRAAAGAQRDMQRVHSVRTQRVGEHVRAEGGGEKSRFPDRRHCAACLPAWP